MDRAPENLMVMLEEARRRSLDAASTLDDLSRTLVEIAHATAPGERACRGLVELLGVDDAWLVAGGEVVCSHHLSRSAAVVRGLRAVALAATAEDAACRHSDGHHSAVMAPVPGAAVLVGTATRSRVFSDAELAVARSLAAAIPCSVAVAAGGRQTGRRLELLRALSSALIGAHTEADVAQVVVTKLRRMVDYDTCRIYLLDEARGVVAPIAADEARDTHPVERFEDLECRVGEGVAGIVVDRGEPLLIGGALGQAAEPVAGSRPGDESVVALPLLGEDGTIGAIVLTRDGDDRFDDGDVHLLEVIAAQTAAACESARAQADTREAAEIAEALLDLGAVLSLPSELDGVATLLVRAVDRMVDCAAIQLWLRDGDDLALAAQVGHTPAVVASLTQARLPVAAEPFADALDTRRVTIRESAGMGSLPDMLGGLPAGSTLAVVAVGERAANRGAIVVQRGPRRGPPAARDRRMLQGIADQALLAITNLVLYRDLERSFLETVQALANALETKDEYTGDHAQALIGLCTSVASRIGMSGTALRDVSFAAALHDIGKIGI
ncbi:MAG TPA: GAF domain-containing protein, partial [Gaiellales bacterium]|nr:GAF domain-containing protein [Gaiellales bacterium]